MISWSFLAHSAAYLETQKEGPPKRVVLNVLVGFAVGLAGGLVGLGGAELRLPYLVGTLRLRLTTAIPVNMAVSLLTLLAALPTRLYTLNPASLVPFLLESAALGVGAALGAYAGVGLLRRISLTALRRAVFGLLLALGLVMIGEAIIAFNPVGVFRETVLVRASSGVFLGLLIGAISAILGVAGGEIIIPTLIFGFGVPIKVAGSLSQMVSIPTVVTSLVRHYRTGALSDREIAIRLILPMGIGAIAGGIAGGLLAHLAPSGLLKAVLGVILITSSVKVFANSTRSLNPR
jgi:uncharacterized membrane protein YfcA